jgi:hypothetical protein
MQSLEMTVIFVLAGEMSDCSGYRGGFSSTMINVDLTVVPMLQEIEFRPIQRSYCIAS